MKNFFLFSILIFTVNCSFCQTSINEMDECSFFDYLKTIKNNSYRNYDYKKLKENEKEKINLLKRLERYLVVFGNDTIAPMYLDTLNNVQNKKQSILTFIPAEYCSEFTKEYYKALDTLKINDARAAVQKNRKENILFLILDLCELNNSINNNFVERYLAEFKNPYTLEYMYFAYEELYFENNEDNNSNEFPQLIKEQNLKMLAQRMDILDNKNYMYFENYNSKPNLIKGFEMYHENDVFTIVPGMNQDRELTGGFKFTIVTDYLKWRWLRIGNKKEDNILTYQTISLSGSGYTPYIRYRNNFDLADSLHKSDRPFASFLCLERAKHRTWRNGLVRHKGEFQVGTMGISQGRKIQAKLHEDVITSSQFVYGWDKQIANGGRLVIQANHKFDFLLHSNTNRYKTVFKPKHFLVNDPNKYSGRNFIGEFDVKVGTIMTSLGMGVRFSTLDFLKQSGNQMIISKPKTKDGFGWKFDIGLNYRYVVHNSLLEGMGLFNSFDEDPYDKVSRDSYVLDKSEIERNMFILDFGLSLKWRKTTVFFRNTFHTLEYKSRLAGVDFQNQSLTSSIDSKDLEYYNNTVIQEQNTFLNNKVLGRQIYGYGTLGISWIIE